MLKWAGAVSRVHPWFCFFSLNSAVELAARERKEHKESRFADAAGGWILHLPGEARNVQHIHSNDFVYAFFVFFFGHSIAASKLRVPG